MAEYVNGINPDILKWARERSGYTVAAIATALKKDVSIINDWESGERSLTYVQLEKLADGRLPIEKGTPLMAYVFDTNSFIRIHGKRTLDILTLT